MKNLCIFNFHLLIIDLRNFGNTMQNVCIVQLYM